MSNFLSCDSPFTYVWHENGGQSIADNTSKLTCNVTLDGLSINVAADTILEQPIILINSASAANKSINSVNIGANAQVSIIEYMMADDKDSSNHVSTTINCAPGSQLQHCLLQHSAINTSIKQQAAIKIVQQADSMVRANIFSFGGGTNRIELTVSLEGSNAMCDASSLAHTDGTQIQDVLLTIDHKHPNATSTTLARGVVRDSSVTNFTGRIIVQPGAKQTIADLQIKNLLCSPKAQATNKPELEIFNDDVRCSHGSSTGQLDEAALFYMQSRGIGLTEATNMLINGFIQPVIESCAMPDITNFVRNLIKGT
jgi:Fe-S cluster assembly protein SufD